MVQEMTDWIEDPVLTITMRFGEEEHFVAESWEDYESLVGDIYGLEQCDNCGNAAYRLLPTRKLECVTDPDDTEFTDGCGATYRVHWHSAADTIGAPYAIFLDRDLTS